MSDSSIKVLAPHILDKPFPGTYIISYKHTSPIVFATDVLANSSFALHAFGRKIPNQLPNETQVLIFDRSKTFHLIDGARGFVTHSFTINDVDNIIGIAGSRKHTNEFAVLTDTYVYIYQMTLDGCAEIDAQPIYGVSIKAFQGGYMVSDKRNELVYVDFSQMATFVKNSFSEFRCNDSIVVTLNCVDISKAEFSIYGESNGAVGIKLWNGLWDLASDWIVTYVSNGDICVIFTKDTKVRYGYKMPDISSDYPVFLFAFESVQCDAIIVYMFSKKTSYEIVIPYCIIQKK